MKEQPAKVKVKSAIDKKKTLTKSKTKTIKESIVTDVNENKSVAEDKKSQHNVNSIE